MNYRQKCYITAYTSTMAVLWHLSSMNIVDGHIQCFASAPSGTYRGFVKNSVLTSKPFCNFLGLRYAKAPQGELRFQFPILAPPLRKDVVYSATEDGSPCLQYGPNGTVGEEDCLYVNVFTPEPLENRPQVLKPVLVLVHEGGFSAGSASSKEFSPDFIIQNDIIFVTINYRLNVFGFLNYNTHECGGNMGLRDILLALEWIKKNIRSFGGDPDRVTLSGVSAGGVSVAFITFSPVSRGLFRAMISQSPVYQTWISSETQQASLDFAKFVGYNSNLNNSLEIVRYLRSLPAQRLVVAFQAFITERQGNQPFMPSPDISLGNAALFPTTNLVELGKNVPNIPIIAGQSNLDGAYIFNPEASLLEDRRQVISYVRQRLSEYFPAYTRQQLAKVDSYYFDHETDFRKLLLRTIYAVTDSVFFYFYQLFSAFRASLCNNNIYTYQFSYDGTLKNTKILDLGNYSSYVVGAAHAQELTYQYYSSMDYPNFTAATFNRNDRKMSYELTTLWSNFVKTGDPNSHTDGIAVVWKPITAARKSFLQIDVDTRLIRTRINEYRREVLDSFLSYPKNDDNPHSCQNPSWIRDNWYHTCYKTSVIGS